MLLAFLFRGFVCHQGLWSRDATQGARGEDEQAELHKARKAQHGEFEVFVLHFLVVFAVVIKVTYKRQAHCTVDVCDNPLVCVSCVYLDVCVCDVDSWSLLEALSC